MKKYCLIVIKRRKEKEANKKREKKTKESNEQCGETNTGNAYAVPGHF